MAVQYHKKPACPLAPHPDAMILAVADVDPALMEENAMGAGQFAEAWVAVGTVTALAGPNQRGDLLGSRIDHSNRVVLRVDNKDVSVWGTGDAFRAVKPGFKRWPVITGESGFAGSSDPLDSSCALIDCKDGIALAKHKINPAAAVGIDGARPVERHIVEGSLIWRALALARSGKRANAAGLRIDNPNAMVGDIANQQVAGGVESDAVRLAELGFHRRSTVTRKTRRTAARNRCNDAGPPVNSPDAVIVALHHVQVSIGIESHFVGSLQQSRRCRPAVTREASAAIAGHGGNPSSLQIDPPDAGGVQIAEIQRAIWTDDHSVWVADRRL